MLSNKKPIISGASDKTIKIGDSFDAKANITATDKEDGDLTSKIVVSGSVNTSMAGEYTEGLGYSEFNINIVNYRLKICRHWGNSHQGVVVKSFLCIRTKNTITRVIY